MHSALRLAAVATLCFLLASPALAHEFIVKPGKASAKPGETVSVNVLSAHVFMASEELEDQANVKVRAVDASGSREVALKANQKTQAYEGQASFAKPGYGMLLGHRLPEVWTRTPGGMQKGPKSAYPGATVSNMYEKFAKTLVLVGAADEAWRKPAGQRLEIMPLESPAGYRAGREASFLVLFDGKPLSTEVFATYDGCTKTPNSYAWFTEGDDKGVARVKFAKSGLWMVRVQHKAPGKDGVSEHVLRSVLVFEVK